MWTPSMPSSRNAAPTSSSRRKITTTACATSTCSTPTAISWCSGWARGITERAATKRIAPYVGCACPKAGAAVTWPEPTIFWGRTDGPVARHQGRRHDHRADGALRHPDARGLWRRCHQGGVARGRRHAADRSDAASGHGPGVSQHQPQQALDLPRPENASWPGSGAAADQIGRRAGLYVRPQAMARLNLGYEVVSAINPRLIYAGVYGFGQDGPYAAKPAYDDLIQGATGLPALMAETGDGTPRYVPNALVDRIVGLTAVGAICASLVDRERTGRGQRVDIPMFETMAGFVMGDHMGGLTYEPPLDKGGYARHLSRDRRPYKTSDGYLSVIVYNDKQWESFFKATGRDDLRNDPKFATFAGRATNIDVVYGELARIFETRSTAEWIALLNQADVPVMPMHDLKGILDDEHLVATGFFPVVQHPSEGPIRSMKVSASFSET